MTTHSKPLHMAHLEEYGNLMLKMEDGFHHYSKEEIFNVLKMCDTLYEICPAPRDLQDGGKQCPMNCPFRKWKDMRTDNFQPDGCIFSRALIANAGDIKEWASKQLSKDWKRPWRDSDEV